MRAIYYLPSSIFIAALLLITSVFAIDNVFSSWGKAIGGYDPVAYFKENKAVKGKKQFSHSWDGATWYFASKQNLDDFISSPQAYAPQYGGYCAYAVSRGYTASTDPYAWSIVDGKLYLNYSKATRETWSEDEQENINEANQSWPQLLNK